MQNFQITQSEDETIIVNNDGCVFKIVVLNDRINFINIDDVAKYIEET